ncbi:hypothetical protein ETH_00037050 [Eimeria tenella]|uniref:Uncharacterized protein n=1 Tax=Eimeria tenella TaxID=5802 RepID=U6KQ64_EIMTE|nr:hypothetical protein ETH_00037050 [Eimeria tenella]CDJ40106.1 hypothetical protein ETH_00037050 [Eimeria tenella]|eukprot:XP_013230859.1 hypothetical protein ETH_00037050 [Eimeria tenella]
MFCFRGSPAARRPQQRQRRQQLPRGAPRQRRPRCDSNQSRSAQRQRSKPPHSHQDPRQGLADQSRHLR